MKRRYEGLAPQWRREHETLIREGYSLWGAYREIASRYGVSENSVADYLDPRQRERSSGYAKRWYLSNRTTFLLKKRQKRLEDPEGVHARENAIRALERADPERAERWRAYLRPYQRFVRGFSKWAGRLFQEAEGVVSIPDLKSMVKEEAGIEMKETTIRRLMDVYIAKPRGPPIKRTRNGYVRTDLDE